MSNKKTSPIADSKRNHFNHLFRTVLVTAKAGRYGLSRAFSTKFLHRPTTQIDHSRQKVEPNSKYEHRAIGPMRLLLFKALFPITMPPETTDKVKEYFAELERKNKETRETFLRESRSKNEVVQSLVERGASPEEVEKVMQTLKTGESSFGKLPNGDVYRVTRLGESEYGWAVGSQ